MSGGALNLFANPKALVALVAAVLVVAWLVNRFAPHKRKRIRRAVIILALYLISAGAASLLDAGGFAAWAGRLRLVADLTAAFTIVNLVTLALFDLTLPAMGVVPVSITTDLILFAAYIVTTIAVLRTAGVDPTSVVTVSAVFSGVLALSMQATLGNVLGGVALQLDDSIHVGDWIQLDNGRQGKVKEIRWRHTVVETRDWDTIIVPNASLLAGNITILGKREGKPIQHRMWVYFCVDFRYPPSQVIHVAQEALRTAPIEHASLDPPPNVICMDFSKEGRESYGYYAARYWLTDLAADDPTSSVIRARIYAALRRAKIPLARPSRTVFRGEDEEYEQRRLDRHRGKRIAAVKGMELFKSLTPEEVDYLSNHLVYAPFAEGETITKKGAVAHWLYILISGQTDVYLSVDGAPPKVVATLSAPSFFGEMGLMTGEPRSADVVAKTDVECYRLDKEGFQKILHDRPEIAGEFSTTLAQRRVEQVAVREGLDAEARKAREASEHARILRRIEDFFGLAA